MPDLESFRISEAEYRGWTPIGAALDIVAAVMGTHGAAQAIAERLRANLLAAAAENIVGTTDPKDRVDFVKVPPQYWSAMWVANPQSMFWRTGQVTFTYRPPSSLRDQEHKATYFGLRVDPAGLAKLVPPVAVPVMAKVPHAGGRPAWGGWEDLWAEIARQLYCGELIPKKQADIENAMLAITEASDGPKIAVVRHRARKLWQAIKKDEN
jgi:hypothetical protein